MDDMKKFSLFVVLAAFFLLNTSYSLGQSRPERQVGFNSEWKFYLGDAPDAPQKEFNDSGWKAVQLPHDWSITLPFDSTSPTGTGGGALRGGLGWYRKIFSVPAASRGKQVFIDFDGVYCNSEVFINGHSLGLRPNGFISFQYDLTPYLNYGKAVNVIAVKVDNSQQPNSRWYSGSGIYRNVWLETVNPVHIDHWGVSVTTPVVDQQSARVVLTAKAANSGDETANITVKTTVYDEMRKAVRSVTTIIRAGGKAVASTQQEFTIALPRLWSVDHPYLYNAVTQLFVGTKLADEYSTRFGIRYFDFDAATGFSLNGKRMKIIGVCDHHDLGCLGAAVNRRALERQLEILKGMGCNGIRTSHNPPAPELLELCDRMGFIVMDEAFDMWKKPKNKFDYHLNWDAWHRRDMEDQVLRDRNHPSVFIWSIGNEIPEQWSGKDGMDSSGSVIARELAAIVRSLDSSRPITAALNDPRPGNAIYKSGVLDLVGFNYHHQDYQSFPVKFPGQKFIATETVSALMTRGHYDMPSDSIRRWPERWDKPFDKGNPDLTCSAYDNCSAPWGSTHEETLKELMKYDFASGMFIWTGFDYLGEPTPYPWPARSSYFGIVDLAGFPKDVYYLYQSLFTPKPVLYIFPHWNWSAGETVDVWAYYNQADEVELFLNGQSLGKRNKENDAMHVMWRVKFAPGTLKAVSRKNGKTVLEKVIQTAGLPSGIQLTADRNHIHPDGTDLSFVSVKIVDAAGNLVPYAADKVTFSVKGKGFIAGTDNGNPTSMESFQSLSRKAFNGLCLAVIQSNGLAGDIVVSASAPGLKPAVLTITAR